MTMTDAGLAAHLAATAGKLLLEVRASGVFADKALGTAGDQTANQFLVRAIREQRPDDGLLSEEEKDNFDRLARSRVWIVDPVDGTREYGEERTDWAVHVGLSVDGVAIAGAVALPGLGVVLRSDRPEPLSPAPERPRMVVSRTRPPPIDRGVSRAAPSAAPTSAHRDQERWRPPLPTGGGRGSPA